CCHVTIANGSPPCSHSINVDVCNTSVVTGIISLQLFSILSCQSCSSLLARLGKRISSLQSDMCSQEEASLLNMLSHLFLFSVAPSRKIISGLVAFTITFTSRCS